MKIAESEWSVVSFYSLGSFALELCVNVELGSSARLSKNDVGFPGENAIDVSINQSNGVQ